MGCRCPPEFSGEHCEIPDKAAYHAKAAAAMSNRQSQPSPSGDVGTVLAFSVVFAGGLAVALAFLVRHLRGRRYSRNPITGSLPGLPSSYRDDKLDDSDGEEDNYHDSDDGDFGSAYAQQPPASMIAMEEYSDAKEFPKIV